MRDSKLIIEIEIIDGDMNVMLDGQFNSGPGERIGAVAILIHQLGLDPTEALSAVAHAFTDDMDHIGVQSGECTTVAIPIPTPKKKDE